MLSTEFSSSGGTLCERPRDVCQGKSARSFWADTRACLVGSHPEFQHAETTREKYLSQYMKPRPTAKQRGQHEMREQFTSSEDNLPNTQIHPKR